MGAHMFQLARNSPLRTTLVDEATGHAKYQIDTPIRLIGSVTRIRKFNLSPQPPLVSVDTLVDDDPRDIVKKKGGFKWSNLVKADLPRAGDEIGRILWKFFSPDEIVFKGKAVDRKEFVPKFGEMENLSFKFTGPDGVQYRWVLGAMKIDYHRLVTTDEKKTEIARFYRARSFPMRQKARLVVQPAGIDMVDQIVSTFVIAEQRRRERDSESAIIEEECMT